MSNKDAIYIDQENTLQGDPVEQGKNSIPENGILLNLADLFKNFSDPTRIKILYALLGNELCVRDIADILRISQSAISHQLRILKQSHLVKARRCGKNILYSLADEHVATILSTGMDHIIE